MPLTASRKFSIAPMMGYTHRHARYFFRLLNKNALLYTEMVHAQAVLRNHQSTLGFSPFERPLALQIGGNNPVDIANAAKIGEQYGYDEININFGCPSKRVQSGTFGAVLLLDIPRCAAIISMVKQLVRIPVTAKIRIGVDEQNIDETLPILVKALVAAGCDHIIVHARKAILAGLNPKQNRSIPPLQYQAVYDNAQPASLFSINGGIATIQDVTSHLQRVDGCMIGRACIYSPDIVYQANSLWDDKGDSVQQIMALWDAYAQSQPIKQSVWQIPLAWLRSQLHTRKAQQNAHAMIQNKQQPKLTTLYTETVNN